MDRTSPAFVQSCRRHQIDPALAAAIITVESAWNPWAVRCEPTYKWTWMVEEHAAELGITQTTERTLQKTSWGLMQVMGATARELGFNAPLTQLVLPEMGLDWGLRYLAQKVKRHKETTDVIASYNAGSPRRGSDGRYKNQDYVDKVLAAMVDQKKVPA